MRMIPINSSAHLEANLHLLRLSSSMHLPDFMTFYLLKIFVYQACSCAGFTQQTFHFVARVHRAYLHK